MSTERSIWSERDKATIHFDYVTGIEVVYDPVTIYDDIYEKYDVFDWTLEFTVDGDYKIQHCYYMDENEAKYEAYLYAKECWEVKIPLERMNSL